MRELSLVRNSSVWRRFVWSPTSRLAGKNCCCCCKGDSMQEYEIERLGHQGDGIASGPIYAFQTLPGEIVTGEPKGNRLESVRIVTPSSDRVRPPCRHYKSCGGCQMQHASDDFVARWKTEIVEKALAAHGLRTDILPIKTSPPQSRRRATFSAKRTKKGATAGFHGRASDVIVEI